MPEKLELLTDGKLILLCLWLILIINRDRREPSKKN